MTCGALCPSHCVDYKNPHEYIYHPLVFFCMILKYEVSNRLFWTDDSRAQVKTVILKSTYERLLHFLSSFKTVFPKS